MLFDTTAAIRAPQAEDVIIGVEVCKERLDLFEYHRERSYSISNDAAALTTWFNGFAGRLSRTIGLAWAGRGGDVLIFLAFIFGFVSFLSGNSSFASVDREDWYRLSLTRRSNPIWC